MKALEKIRSVSEILSRQGIESSEKEAQLIVTQCLALDLADIYRDDPVIRDEKTREINSMVSRRSLREPLQYILGRIDFMGLTILLGSDVLIPRPETEMMVEYAVKVFSIQYSVVSKRKHPPTTDYRLPTSDYQRVTILDLCTGSGCIALALAKSFPGAQVYGVDLSEAAIRYAKKNALVNGIHNAGFLCGSMFDAVKSDQRFDMIIANPPYIPASDIRNLQPEISQWEPRSALDGGADGLDAYRTIVPAAGNFLKNNGILILELGTGLAQSVAGMARSAGFSGIAFIKDLAGIERTFRAAWTR